ncbi:MAG: hypothetical protein KA004_11840 [Verrucomicrobiales bacterium]|nr:hypothetical protein [Verrucomicrobiales bacterium]
MMFRLILPVLCSGLFLATTAWADPVADKKTSREIVDRMAAEFRQGKLDLIFARTHPGLIEELGGREAFEKTTRDAVAGFAKQGVEIKAYTTGEPEEPVIHHGRVFVLIPTRLVMVVQKNRVTSSGWMLCIRPVAGSDWQLLTLGRELSLDRLKKLEPNLPDDFVLPDCPAPKIESLEDGSEDDAGKRNEDGKKPQNTPQKVKPA